MPDDDDAETRTIVIAGPHSDRAVTLAGSLVLELDLKHLVVLYDVETGGYFPARRPDGD